MSRGRGLWLLLAAPPALAQQGLLPLSRTVDAPFTARMHHYKAAAHPAIRPYFREDLAPLPGADTTLEAAWPWLQEITDPARTLHGGPLVETMAGASFGEHEVLKYRAGMGGWLEWNASSRWTLQADARYWRERLPDYLDRYAYVHQAVPGEGVLQGRGPDAIHYDLNGYADYKAGAYFHLTLGKGRHFFGEGYRSLLLSDETTGYPYFKITTTAWHLRYVNLLTLMRNTPTARATDLTGKKFASIHYLSWNISKRVNAGFFEAIVWQDNDPAYPRGFDLSYLNPVIFLRPVEYGLGSPDNALLGAALNVKVGRSTLAYAQLVLDEFLLSHVRAGDGWYGNKQGVQAGVVGHGVLGTKGLSLRVEVNYARPFMYIHSDPRQNYAHLGQPLAHPYGAGFVETLVQAEWRSGPWLVENVSSWGRMGQDTASGPGANTGNNIFLSDLDRPKNGDRYQDLGYYTGRPVEATVVQNELRVGRLLEPRSGLMLEAAWTARWETMANSGTHPTNYLRLGLSANLHQQHPFQTVR
ncbi:MAG: hypothetical protein KBH07_04135 [Flavobacteriales bacterium]|nr:hypothetical protein [Flavobacteriales bacterium]